MPVADDILASTGFRTSDRLGMEASPMRLLLLIAGAALFANGLVVLAEDRKFPYEAIVEVEDGENVRSGPGPKYYPTDKLQKGDRVLVHRHDPGGWCMISPPPGSFSWIRAEHVQKSGKDSGVLKTNGVVVHIGSTINPEEFTTVQANLSKSDAVEILGEKNFQFDDGPRLMYKISPVKREWRWIPRNNHNEKNAPVRLRTQKTIALHNRSRLDQVPMTRSWMQRLALKSERQTTQAYEGPDPIPISWLWAERGSMKLMNISVE